MKKYQKYSKELKQEIINRYLAGESAKELAVITKQLQSEQLQGEFLKKHFPFDKKLCQREREEILNSKDFKIKAFVYIEEYQFVYSVKFMCEFLPVTRQSYYKWIKVNKIRISKVNYEKDKQIKLSMSDSGFKHNAPTEALNGWIKEKFYHTYGKKFKSYDELIEKFNKYIINWNNLKMYLQTNNPVVVQPQDYRNQIVNLAC